MKSLISTIAISYLFSASVDAQGLREGDIFEAGLPFSGTPFSFNIAQMENIQFQAVATGIGMDQTNFHTDQCQLSLSASFIFLFGAGFSKAT